MSILSAINNTPVLGDLARGAAATSLRAVGSINSGGTRNDLFNSANAITDPNRSVLNPASTNAGILDAKYGVQPATSTGGGGGGGTSSTYTGSTGSRTSSSGGGGAASQANSANIAAYQDQFNALNQLLGSLDATQGSKTNQINSSYNNNLSILNDSQSRALSKLATQRDDTTNDYGKTLQTINANARNGFNSLQMLLGGTGSAGNVLAPFAVSTQANKQRGASSDSFAKNLRGISTAESDAQNQYNLNKRSLEESKNTGLANLISSINSQKQNYLSQRDAAQNQLNIAKGGKYVSNPSGSAITALLNEQAGLADRFKVADLTVNPVEAKAADLTQYQADAAKLAQGGSDAAPGEDTTAAQLAALLKQNQDDQFSSYSY